MQASEPGVPKEIILKEGLVVNLWTKWEFGNSKEVKVKDLRAHIKEKYGLEVKDVMKQGQAIYLDAVLSIEGKEKDKEEALEQKFYDLLESEEDYLDVEITCYLPQDETKKILEGVPPVRIQFSPK